MNLRNATAADWPSVSALLTQEKLPLEGVREHFDEFIVATTDDTIVGCIGLERYGDAGLLRSAVVASTHRGTGLGVTLTDACLDSARTTGIRTMVLLTETAEQFFSRRGFTRVTRADVPVAVHASREFQGACPASAVVMIKELAAEPR